MKRLCLIAVLAFTLYLGTYNGYLALYEKNASSPSQVLPYRCALYPKIDQAAFEEGIPISTPEQLKKLLEDFLS